MDGPIPLGPEDRAILDLEGPTIAGHTCKVVLMGRTAPDVGALRAAIGARLDAAPPLRWRLGGPADAPTWVAGPVDLERHVTAVAVDAPLDEAGLRAEVARLFAQRLDRGRPLWQIDAVPYRDGAALVGRVHHALADGTTTMRFARAVLWDAAGAAPPPAPAQRRAEHAADDARRRRRLAGFLAREFSRSRERSPFDGHVGSRREIAFARVELGPLHDAAREQAGATVNDAVLAIVAGALRRWVLAHRGRPGEVRVRVPVSLHHEGDLEGNRDAFFAVALPLDEPDPVRRLRIVRAETAERKAGHDAETMDALLRDLGAISPRLRALAERVEAGPRRFALNVSNVPGPRGPVTVLGAPVDALHSIAEIGERHALRVAVVSVAGLLCFGFCADPGIVENLQAMADGVVAEAALLTA
ncbi:MAG: DUF1298 domain-containing protein [Solirubrobacteraceae bacterium]|nr:DUF1298 domain-containing protein [Solirubrobacteraceae bacterium]